ncbi:Nuclear pore complex protein Nup50 [Chamberlinius hualienensis]
MSKRRPDYELTHDNWDEDLPSEDAGKFDVATNDVLNKRVIKKAKRRLPDGPTKSVFAGFTGFGKSPPNSNGNLFSFLGNPTQNVECNNTVAVSSTEPLVVATDTTTLKPVGSDVALKAVSKSRMEYLQQLRKLNEDFVAWIKSHFDKNPYLDLTPVFKDYTDHLKLIEEKHSEGSSSGKKLNICSPVVKLEEKEKGVITTPLSTIFTVAKPVEPIVSTTPAVTAVDSTANNATDKDEEEEKNYQPEVKVVEEENTKYKTRCKLFYKKEGSFVDKGVGTLYIKQAEKPSLLIRAETSLSNILLNIGLNSSIPVQKAGKCHVTLICIPNPPLSTKGEDAKAAVTFLIKVKDSDVADELLKQLEEAKKVIS